MRHLVLHTAATVVRFVEPTGPKQAQEDAGRLRGRRPRDPPALPGGAPVRRVLRRPRPLGRLRPGRLDRHERNDVRRLGPVRRLSVFAAGGTVVAAIAAAVLLNARYGPMGLAAARSFRGGAARRAAESQLLVDESWAVSQDGGRFDIRRMLGAGLVLYAGWVGGTVIGVVAGGTLGDPATLGLDAAFPALFLALLVPLVRNRRALAAALAGGGIALLLTPLDARRRAGDSGHLRRPLRPAARARRAPGAGAGESGRGRSRARHRRERRLDGGARRRTRHRRDQGGRPVLAGDRQLPQRTGAWSCSSARHCSPRSWRLRPSPATRSSCSTSAAPACWRPAAAIALKAPLIVVVLVAAAAAALLRVVG